MATSLRLDVIDRSFVFAPGFGLSPQERSEALAEFAAEVIAETAAENERILGAPTPAAIAVDGVIGKPLAKVRPDGTIVATFDLSVDVIAYVWDQLIKHSPVKSGRYARSHRIFADHVEVATPAEAASAQSVIIAPVVPYARKIEKRASGVYQAVAALAMARFGNIASIKYRMSEVEAPGSPLAAWAGGHSNAVRHERRRAAQRRKDLRQPAIEITWR